MGIADFEGKKTAASYVNILFVVSCGFPSTHSSVMICCGCTGCLSDI